MERLKAIWNLIHNDKVLKIIGLIGVIIGTNKGAITTAFPEVGAQLDAILWILVSLGLYNHTIPFTPPTPKV